MNKDTAIIQPVKGTRDFYPEIMRIQNWLYGKIRKISELYGYEEYEGPILESFKLYAARSGDELVKEQSYVFPDRDGDLITLRPELTPTLARMVAKRQRELVYPLRWWSFGPFWRYERPQKGRTREFFQWNLDLIGTESPQADAEIIAVVAAFFKELTLPSTKVKILVNNRKLMDAELEQIGVAPADTAQTYRLIDRRDKMREEEWERYASELGYNAEKIDGLISLLESYDLWEKSDDLQSLFRALEAIGAAEYVQYDPGIIRGLDYYTGTVFEAVDTEGEIRRSILGGGRYNNLLEAVGGEPLPAMGFAMGDVVMTLILEKYNLLPKEQAETDRPIFISMMSEKTQDEALMLAAELRQAGINTIVYPESTKLSKQLKFADRRGLRLVIIAGEDELKERVVSIKDLVSGVQHTVPRTQVSDTIWNLIKGTSPASSSIAGR